MTRAPSGTASGLLVLALMIWGGLYLYSFWLLFTMESTGDGFTRGMNRVTGFLGWQMAAAAVGLVCFMLSRGQPKGSLLHKAGAAPLVVALALLALGAAIILWVRYAPSPF